MVNKSEPNAQNSELDAEKHPSGARIERMFKEHDARKAAKEKGMYGETLRPSERETSDATYIPPDDKAEGDRTVDPVIDPSEAPHRTDPNNR